MATDEVVDGEVEGPNPGYSHPTHPTSKKGCVIVKTGTKVDCPECEGFHVMNSDLDQWVPLGHGHHVHWKCPNTDRNIAAEYGTNRHYTADLPD